MWAARHSRDKAQMKSQSTLSLAWNTHDAAKSHTHITLSLYTDEVDGAKAPDRRTRTVSADTDPAALECEQIRLGYVTVRYSNRYPSACAGTSSHWPEG
jgi:hypothetical protein